MGERAQQGICDPQLFDELKRIALKKAEICKDIEDKKEKNRSIVTFYNKVVEMKAKMTEQKEILTDAKNANAKANTNPDLAR